ncbi:MAG TPA: metallophosphoesterase [Clostridiales bacterium]|nr:metallophosphoesterase [Clostridiales bacterium]
MKFAVLSDLHYVSPEMITDKTNTEAILRTAVVSHALDMATKEADIILITGDLTNDGDIVSHNGLIEILRKYKKAGKKIYVLTATHDFHHHRAYVKKTDGVHVAERPWDMPYFDIDKHENLPDLVKAATPTKLWELYKEFGRDDAVEVCDEGYSYYIEIGGCGILMLNDCFRNMEAMHEQSPTFSPETFDFIAKMIKKCESENKPIFACTHHPFVPPAPAYRLGTNERNMRSEYTGKILAKMGLKLIFTGHTHFASIKTVESDCGSIMYDVNTPSVNHYPPRFRVVDFDVDSRVMNLRSVEVDTPDGFTVPEGSLHAHYRKGFYEEYKAKIENLPTPLNKLTTLNVKSLLPLCKKRANLSKEEIKSIENINVFDLLFSVAMNMLTGDGKYTPETAEYKFLSAFAENIDKVIGSIPYDIKNKKLKGYSISEIVLPMLYNAGVPDNNAVLNL